MADAAAETELDRLVRRADEDRWLASRFAPRAVRDTLIAVYALNAEIARARTREPAVAALRLAWHRDQLQAIHAGAAGPPAPAFRAYAAHAHALPGEVWPRLIEANLPPAAASPAETLDQEVASAQAVMCLALAACGVKANVAVDEGGRAWGLLNLLRASPDARGALDLSRKAYDAARREARSLPAAAFPAIGYLALIPVYLAAIERGKRTPALLFRQVCLVAAAATGRL